MKVVIDSAIRLERVFESDTVAKFAEIYYGWPTGTIIDVEADATARRVEDVYRATQSKNIYA